MNGERLCRGISLSVLFVFIRALRGSNVWCLVIQARRDVERFGAHRDAATSRSGVGFIRIPSSAPPRLRVNPSAILDRMTGFAGWTGGEERKGIRWEFL